MSSSLRRGARAAAAIAFSILPLAACGAGHNAQTLEIKPDNAATTVGDIKVQNAVVITQPDLESTGPAAISATLFNSGRTAQTLDSVTVEGKSAELKPAKGKSLSIPAGGSLVIGGENNASAVLASGREAVQDGNVQKVTFTFSKTGDVTLQAFVVPAEHYFSSWGPTEVPAAPGASATPSGTPSKNASASPGESPASPTDEASTSATPTESSSEDAAAGH
ncbi:DUF461 domain-containing protein [Streptomyces sp. S.PNR 29]|uniref:DUF461 domain-containing protein n=1 Tax=Streptomyces sp. S.PNR 29 TaxID=2973805 RepID=UPI0025AF1B16|nr:DUF461 domain-containing protein [Streptomyces sp. S.PNR 29]MDN0194224.1 DUF461 domain-containing protein [Streptomyces sp. S.PNR 29]